MFSTRFWGALALAGLISGPAFASGGCPRRPADQWLKADQIRAKAEELGYRVQSIDQDDGCWEIKGTDRDGRKAEVHLDPVTAAVVKTEID